jgi:hypothetical protein
MQNVNESDVSERLPRSEPIASAGRRALKFIRDFCSPTTIADDEPEREREARRSENCDEDGSRTKPERIEP